MDRSPSTLVTSGAGFHTKLAVDTSSANIASVEIDGDQLAFIGIDGVGCTQSGQRGYFGMPQAPFGGMAEKVLVLAEMGADITINLMLVKCFMEKP